MVGLLKIIWLSLLILCLATSSMIKHILYKICKIKINININNNNNYKVYQIFQSHKNNHYTHYNKNISNSPHLIINTSTTQPLNYYTYQINKRRSSVNITYQF